MALNQAVALAAIAACLLDGSSPVASQAVDSEVKWYQRGPIYQIFPLGFSDSDGDGTGDLRGIMQRVDHLKDLGIEAIWMNPIFKSPLKDDGYDISDFYDINPTFGNMTDVEDLIKNLHDNGIRIMLDFVPNHTSDEHQWFLDSIKKVNGKEDFYVWKDPKGTDSNGKPIPPNNWLSLFQGSAWKYNQERKQFYLHQFGTYQPDLNYTNPKVVEAMEDVMRFWLRKGIDGLRVDAPIYLIETNYDKDEPFEPKCEPAGKYDCQLPIYTSNQLESYDIVKKFNDVLEEDEFKNFSKVNFFEAYTSPNMTFKYYDRDNAPFNFQLLSFIRRESNASVFESTVQSWLKNMPEGKWPNWVAGNHDNHRIAARLGEEMVDPMNMILMLLPGLGFTYQGEEIGMTEDDIRTDLQIDGSSFSRDGERAPMLWDGGLNAGFTTAKSPFLPANPNYWKLNAESQRSAEKSHLKVYKSVVKLHKELIGSSQQPLKTHVLSTWVFAFERPQHIIVINLDQLPRSINLGNISGLPETLYVKISSVNAALRMNDVVETKIPFYMRPRAGIVFSHSPASESSSHRCIQQSAILLLATVFLVTKYI